MRLDGRLERVDPDLALREAHRLDERVDVGDVADLLVVEHPVAKLLVEEVDGSLADADDVRARGREPAHELALVRREGRLDEDDVHGTILPAATHPSRGPASLHSPRYMPNAIFVAPFLLPATVRFVAATALASRCTARVDQPGPRGPARRRPPLQRSPGITGSKDGTDPQQIADATRVLSRHLGGVDRIIGMLEQLQVPLGEVRDALGIPGMGAEVAHNFRDKARMKTVFESARRPLRAAPARALRRRGSRRRVRSRLPTRREAAGGGRRARDVPHRRRNSACGMAQSRSADRSRPGAARAAGRRRGAQLRQRAHRR